MCYIREELYRYCGPSKTDTVNGFQVKSSLNTLEAKMAKPRTYHERLIERKILEEVEDNREKGLPKIRLIDTVKEAIPEQGSY